MLTKVETHAVYWAFDGDDRLLYVGRTQDLIERIDTHRRRTKWGRGARWEYYICHSLRAAMVLEKIAIEAGNPVFNVQGKRRSGAF